MNSKERAARKLDRLIDRYGDDVGYSELELMLQHRAQDMREIAHDKADGEPITFEDVIDNE